MERVLYRKVEPSKRLDSALLGWRLLPHRGDFIRNSDAG